MAKKLVILGAGESGVGTALLAKQKGYAVFVSDGGAIKANFQKELEEASIEFESGSHTVERILAADEVMKSPGIPEKNEMVKCEELLKLCLTAWHMDCPHLDWPSS